MLTLLFVSKLLLPLRVFVTLVVQLYDALFQSYFLLTCCTEQLYRRDDKAASRLESLSDIVQV